MRILAANPKKWCQACVSGLLIMGLLSGCDQVSERIGNQITQSLPKPTPQQEQLANDVYLALAKQDFEWLLKQPIHPDTLQKWRHQPQTLAYLAAQIPKGNGLNAPILTHINLQSQQHETTVSLTYQHTYALELVSFTIVFVGAKDSTTIADLHIQKQMNSNTPTQTPPQSISA